jgi:hypothetical protein
VRALAPAQTDAKMELLKGRCAGHWVRWPTPTMAISGQIARLSMSSKISLLVEQGRLSGIVLGTNTILHLCTMG